MSFSDVIEEKIASLEKQVEQIRSLLLTPDYHAQIIAEKLSEVPKQIEDLPDDPGLLKQEIVSLLEQVPHVVQSIWTTTTADIKTLQGEISRWKEMGVMYEEYVTNAEKSAAAKEELTAAIASGEVTEPTRHSAMRRPTGTRPPVSLGGYRRLADELGSGEDSEG